MNTNLAGPGDHFIGSSTTEPYGQDVQYTEFFTSRLVTICHYNILIRRLAPKGDKSHMLFKSNGHMIYTFLKSSPVGEAILFLLR